MSRPDPRIAVRVPDLELSAAELDADIFGLRSQVVRGGTASLHTDDAAVVAAAIRALDGWAGTVHLLPPTLGVDVLPADSTVLRPELGRTGTTDGEPLAHDTKWIVYTSGTTGVPKAIAHTASTLSRTVVHSERSASFVWGLLYDPNRMAGLQVLFQALRTRATVVAPSLHSPLAERIEMFVDGGVTAMSATPTLWRLVLQTPSARALDLRQITLGGEIADQRILDGLASAFPAARIVHVFASTETGAAFSVTDGRAGFPISYLDEPPRGIALQIRDGILHVHSPGVSVSGPDGFASTGDIVDIVNDRVMFKGRASGVVNIGGANVWPEEVETLLRQHDDVVEAVVMAKANALSGNILMAQVVARDGVDRGVLRKGLRAWVRDRAPGTHVPAMIKVVDALDVSTTGKVAR